ncbi:MAG: TIGR01244 family phosphatase, partial [Parvularculaceae bacterium]|nr:TIGR01244 family phosphatase [Parvularculaceae bacterium]
ETSRHMTAKFRQLARDFYVAPQIAAGDLADAKALGVALVINNRPENEEPGQPAGSAIAAAARAAGLGYVAIPISGMNVSGADLDAFDDALRETKGPVLAFCRSGTRSTVLRAFARARAGDDVASIIDEAAGAGYDLSGLAPRLAAARSGR